MRNTDSQIPRRNEPKISVIIPGYNNGAFISETINTVLAQTIQPTEIIVVDDGSTDNTKEVVRSIPDHRLQYHHQANSGVSAARNLGISLSTGDFISFLDADDRWRPKTLETQLRLLESSPDVICCFGNFIRFQNETGEQMPDQFKFYHDLPSVPVKSLQGALGYAIEGNAFAEIITFGDFPAFTQTMMFRASMIHDVRFDRRLIRCQDADFALRVFMRGKVVYTKEVLAEVRRHGGNATRDVSLMAIDKLKALLCVREDPKAGDNMHLLEQRIGRAYFDAANALVNHEQHRKALPYWAAALRTQGSKLQKSKRSARLVWSILMSALNK